jgi:hypothetical protein
MNALPRRSLLERHWFLFLLLALLMRVLYAVVVIGTIREPDAPGSLAIVNDDTWSYLAPIEGILNGGTYEPDYRMPGVGAPYWLFRQFLDEEDSLDAMVLLQLVLSGSAVWLLGLLAFRVSGSDRISLIVYALFLLSTHSSRYDTMIASDSLTVSVVIIQAFIFQRAFDRRNVALLMISGLLLTWLLFIRPVASLLFIPATLGVLFTWKSRPSLLAMVWFLAPLSVIETAWVLRNWKVNHEFNPLTNQGMMPDWISERTRGHVMDFVRGYGGNYIWWEPGADIRWYGEWMSYADADDEGRRAVEPPPDAYVPGYDRDSLVLISTRIREIHSGVLPPQDSIAATEWVNNTLDRYSRMHAEGAPFSHHILSRARMLRYLVAQSGCEFLFDQPFSQLSWWKKIIKITQSMFYAFAMFFGAWYIAAALWKWQRAASLLALWIPVVALYMVCVYPLVLKMAEHRWVMHVYPLFLMMAVLIVVPMIERLVRGRVFQAQQEAGA